jgi:RHS repeat-associated protein
MGSGVQAGYKNFIGPMYVINKVTFSDPSNAGATYYQTYSYADGWVSLQGRGFTAFQRVQRYDSRSALYETLGYDYLFPYIRNPVFDSLTFDQASNQPIRFSYASNEQAITLDGTPNNQRYFVYNNTATQKYQVSWSPSAGSTPGPVIETDTTNYTYDNYGNALAVTTTVTDKDSGSPYYKDTWTTTTTNTPDPNTTSWCVRLLSQTQTVYTASNGDAPVTRTRTLTPDTNHCNYTEIVTEPNSSAYKVTEDLGYDAFGNVSADTVTGVGMAARHATLQWGSTGQFPTVVRDASGASITLNYNYSFGAPSSLQDANGQLTTWGQDGFGREILETRSDGTSTSITYNACVAPNTCQPLWRSFVWTYGLDTLGNKLTQSVTTYDAVDRPVEVSTLALNGSYATTLTAYDSLGRVASTTSPFFFGATQYDATYSYDLLNRLTKAQFPTSATNSTLLTARYQYAGDTTTFIDANSNSKTSVADPNGWLRKIIDAANYGIVFDYDAAGSETSVTDVLGNSLSSASYQYGIQPFAVAVADTDLGAWSYTYDALGDITAWVDAKQQRFSQSYDLLSRPTNRYEPDLYTQWTWGTSSAADNVGQLQAVCTGVGANPTACTASGYSKSVTYDTKARPQQVSIVIPSDATYTYTAAYNATTGLLNTLTYPSTPLGAALQVQYAYTNGALQSIMDVTDSPNVTFWTANQVDAAGDVTQETFGNGVVLNHNFDVVTYRPNAITAGVGGSTALQNNSYLFDAVGNLTQHQDNNSGGTESVYYDALNRLDHTVGDTNTQLTYDAMGRLASWTVNGGTPPNTNDYATPQSGCTYYGNAQVHAMRRAEFDPSQPNHYNSYCYDANGNLVSTLVRWPATYSWTSYNQPSVLGGLGSSSQFFYDHNHQRWKQVASYSGSPETTEYIGGLMEKMTNSNSTSYRHYIPAGNTFVEYIRNNTAGTSTYYATQDNLGSTAVITDHTGALVAAEKYAALGWNEDTGAQDSISRHEYTGQEGLDNLGMVNMNGRIYNPSGTFFLSPDPYVPDPTDTRSYNRYAYVNYNPLTLVDPTGYDDTDPGTDPDPGAGSDGSCQECPLPDQGAGQGAVSVPTVTVTAPGYLAPSAIGVTADGLQITEVMPPPLDAATPQSIIISAVGLGGYGLGGVTALSGSPGGATSNSRTPRVQFPGLPRGVLPGQEPGLGDVEKDVAGLIGGVEIKGGVVLLGAGIKGILAIGARDAARAAVPSSRALGRALEASGVVRPAESAAHHIVAGSAQGAAAARATLQRLGIGINDAANGVFLQGAEHAGVHTAEYYNAVNRALAGATTREQAVQILQSIGRRLELGTFP